MRVQWSSDQRFCKLYEEDFRALRVRHTRNGLIWKCYVNSLGLSYDWWWSFATWLNVDSKPIVSTNHKSFQQIVLNFKLRFPFVAPCQLLIANKAQYGESEKNEHEHLLHSNFTFNLEATFNNLIRSKRWWLSSRMTPWLR